MTTQDDDHFDYLLHLSARADIREQSRALARAIDVLQNSSQATSPCLSTCMSSLTKVRRRLRGELGEIRRKLSQQRKRDDLKEAARLAATRLAALGEHLRRAPVSVSPTYMDALDDQHVQSNAAPAYGSPAYMNALDDQHHALTEAIARLERSPQLFSHSVRDAIYRLNQIRQRITEDHKAAQKKQEQQKTDRRGLDDILKELGKDPNVVVCQLNELGDWLQKLWPDRPAKQGTAVKDSGSES